MKPREWIELEPKFEGSEFDGYNQTDGTCFYDNAGIKYKFVPKSAYDALAEKLKAAEAEVAHWKAARQSAIEIASVESNKANVVMLKKNTCARKLLEGK